MGKELLSVAEAARRRGVDQRTVRGWIRRGLLSATRYGDRLWLIRESDLSKFRNPKMGRPRKDAGQPKPARKRKS